MSRTLELYQTVNNLACSELNLAECREPTSSCSKDDDDDGLMEENSRHFLLFEHRLNEISGSHDQLVRHARLQDRGGRESRPAGMHDQLWDKIERVAEAELSLIASKVPSVNGCDDPEAKLTHHVGLVAKTGLVDKNLRRSLAPASLREWISAVARKTAVNKLFEWAASRLFGSTNNQATSNTQLDAQALADWSAADVLYQLLATRDCVDNHGALLNLSGFGGYGNEKSVFNMFLSSCSKDESLEEAVTWHETSCAFRSRSETPTVPIPKLDVCHKVRRSGGRKARVALDFDRESLWVSREKAKIISASGRRRRDYVDIRTLLDRGDLKTNQHDHKLKKFRFTLRLALSLYRLYSGRWIQTYWRSNTLRVLDSGVGTGIDMLDSVYISCNFGRGLAGIGSIEEFLEDDPSESCPKFFVSLAQLLIDIELGEERHRPNDSDKSGALYNALVEEVRKSMKNGPTQHYWEAIEGCLLFLENFERDIDLTPNEVKCARGVIQETIVQPLLKNMEVWEKMPPTSPSQPANHEPFTLGTHTPTESRHGVEVWFDLWSSTDDEWKTIQPKDKPSARSFDAYFEKFVNEYIKVLPLPSGIGDMGRNVRIAIIDTGLRGPDHPRQHDPIFLRAFQQKRITKFQNFIAPGNSKPDPDAWEDGHGHGTQVCRQLLKYAPRAEIIIAKIAEAKSLRATHTQQLTKALEWASENADIINLSFSLGSFPSPELQKEITKIVAKNKLIFAAASNTGGFGSRQWPANGNGVFAIHATNEFGSPNTDMNPAPDSHKDNFSTFGCGIESFWDGDYVSISGTSFATPIAAALAANIVEFARRELSPDMAQHFTNYSTMRALFYNYLTPNTGPGGYHCILPWTKGFWDEDSTIEEARIRIAKVFPFDR